MPNPVSWNFKNFDWTFGNNNSASTSTTTTISTASHNPMYQDNVRQFTGASTCTSSSESEQFTSIPPVPCKRKSLDLAPTRPTKQFISERKMIEHLNGLHLSSEFTNHNISPVDYDEFDENQPHTVFMSPADLEEKLKNAQKITICNEVRKLTDDPLLPKALLERAVPPPYCSALVLWQPPTSILKVHLDEGDEKVEKGSDKKKERGGTSEPQQESLESTMEAEMMFANNNSSNVDFNNLDTMDLDM